MILIMYLISAFVGAMALALTLGVRLLRLEMNLNRLELRSLKREQAIWEAIVNLMDPTGQQCDSTEPVTEAKQ